MKEKISKFTADLLSIDESRKSIVVLVLVMITIFSMYKAVAMGVNGDIPNNCVTIILTLSGLVFGNNAIASIGGIITASKKTQNKEVEEKNNYGI